jgi:hypothetical protein
MSRAWTPRASYAPTPASPCGSLEEVGATQRKVYEQQDVIDALRKRVEELEAANRAPVQLEYEDAAAG